MTRFKLIRTRDGLILTTTNSLSTAESEAARDAFTEFKRRTPDGILVIAECEYVDLDLGVEIEPVSA